VRWLREHALSQGIDVDKLFVGGGSAGGHVAACTGTIDTLDNPKEDRAISSVPNAMVLFNPVINTMKDGYAAGYKLIGDSVTASMISPVDHVTPRTPPTIIFVGTADITAPMAGDLEFQRKMLKLGRMCTVDTFPGKTHSIFNDEPYRTQTIEAGYQFILRVMNPVSTVK
jgi:acetyl esterase